MIPFPVDREDIVPLNQVSYNYSEKVLIFLSTSKSKKKFKKKKVFRDNFVHFK